MKNLHEFNIGIYKLTNKVHEYQFNIDSDFFKYFASSPIEEGQLVADITLDKQETLIRITFDIEGSIQLVCDRSLENFDYPVHIKKSLLFQYGEEETELTDELIIITQNTHTINLAQYIYEFIGIEVPMKKIHPDYRTDDDDLPLNQGEIVFSTEDSGMDTEKNESETDPRWDKLKKFKQ